jgi:hypothetical protein
LAIAIADNGYSAALKTALSEAEGERAKINEELSIDTSSLAKISDFPPNFTERCTRALNALEHTLQSDINKARTSLKVLLGGQITLFKRPSDGFLEAELRPNYGGLIQLAANGHISHSMDSPHPLTGGLWWEGKWGPDTLASTLG